MSLTVNNNETQTEQVNYQRLWWVTPAAASLAAVANAVAFFVGDALGAIPKDFVLSTSNQPLSAGLVASVSFFGVLVGCAIFAGLGRTSRRPITLFRGISLIFLLLFGIGPLTIGANVSVVLLLELMHIIAGAIAITMLTALASRN